MAVSLVPSIEEPICFCRDVVAMILIAKHIKKTMTDGSTVEEYFWEGALHRVDGPAMVRRNVDGSWIERYYRMASFIGRRAPRSSGASRPAA
jgi:hypothetical protein